MHNLILLDSPEDAKAAIEQIYEAGDYNEVSALDSMLVKETDSSGAPIAFKVEERISYENHTHYYETLLLSTKNDILCVLNLDLDELRNLPSIEIGDFFRLQVYEVERDKTKNFYYIRQFKFLGNIFK